MEILDMSLLNKGATVSLSVATSQFFKSSLCTRWILSVAEKKRSFDDEKKEILLMMKAWSMGNVVLDKRLLPLYLFSILLHPHPFPGKESEHV